MKNHFISGVKLTFLTMVLFGIVYPLVITGIARLTAPNGGAGELIIADKRIVGFELIGQSFVSARYFNSRPSAVGYNAAATGGSNKGPTNSEYLAQVEERIDKFLLQNPEVKREQVTVDLVTASGGGLDPHISPAAAEIQVPRIAKARGLSEEVVRRLIVENTSGPLLGLFGTSTVHVLKINLALDQLK